MQDDSLRIDRSAKTLRTLALERMREAIMDFHFQPGERLVERPLCDQLGVSRSVVREVLRQLEAEGLVQMIPGHGPAVAKPDLGRTDEIYELRALLEGIAARACALSATDAQLAVLEGALENLFAAWASGKPPAVMRATTGFYEALFEAADKRVAWEIVSGLNVRINQLRSMTIASANRREPAIAEMNAIMDAIRARRPEEAEAAARRHVESAWKIARDKLRLDPR
ncbi:GntR family transcriptional regulator [Mesorhizobium sp. M1C.F.Ca.ET.193.01.1.1]|uniref:GntR family transcriptional regulator n=2 Tax=Mesorhizobium TaxID=68287 RepID=UPI000FD3FB14|nr:MULTISPECIES: GntR family transcriptional regulator [unclassified Mesorhizobium]TGS92620.1 GntR family transcriptional regulator [bacterium M00.F.Ca.ET.177.01.1.1]RWK01325.1 MAG: GntR family transcriptional regulator [Mesorhizobium sp.]TGQ50333.1 GntR family transcriptional regulator [Mesorhizobium sp. M1C.F.Ca.ET.210.01.1.1]TGQ65264.1 GntR family transcriptional regulator [Mesorhizobium sp. M1C.F.Ca.ET.212.01.1.1]TGQ98999.1 GntR family transcriptional regulator [Mesorhizobium sp. M1C.F.Ca.